MSAAGPGASASHGAMLSSAATGWFLVRAPIYWPVLIRLRLGFGVLVLVPALVALAVLSWHIR